MGTTQKSAIRVIANADTWMEDRAIQQLHRVADWPGMQTVVGMPDLHPGKGSPVGASFLSTNMFYPTLVGNDIGCGMAFWQTDLAAAKWSGQKLAERAGSIDGPMDDTPAIDAFGFAGHSYEHSLGTIGGGNHFAEVQRVDAVLVSTTELAEKAPWLDPKRLQLLVHSGSRGFGEAILREHVDMHREQGLVDGTPAAHHYLVQHNEALRFAQANRLLIGQRLLAAWRAEGVLGLNIHHNYIEHIPQGYLHRKGATPSTQGLVMIPGSRGDFSYLVEPLPSETSLWSLAHGAGRKWQRSDCRGKLGPRVRLQDLLKTDLGSTVVCSDKDLVFEEAPQAYKNVDTVVASLVEAQLVRVLVRFKPVMTYKKNEERCAC